MKKTHAATLLLLLAAASAQAHPGHHHDGGLPDSSAHLLLGLEYLAGVLLVAAMAVMLRHAFRGKSKKSDPPSGTP